MWIVMEKLHMNLHAAVMGKHVQHGRDAPGPFVDMLAGLLNAIAYLHTDQRNPIVHRDLKPANVMLTSDNPPVAKLIDFGLAKETRDGFGSTSNKKGTPEWMAPEQKSGGGCTTPTCNRHFVSHVQVPQSCASTNHLNKNMSLTN